MARTRKIPTWCLAAVSLWAAIDCTRQAKTQREKRPPGELQLTLRTDRTTYSMKDKVHLEVQATNVGDSDMYVWSWIFCWGQGSALSIHALDGKENLVQPASGILLDCVPPPPGEHDFSEFIRLEPGRFDGLAEDFDPRDLVDGPGERTLVVTLGGVLSWDLIREMKYPDLPYWTSEDKPLMAKLRLTFTP